MNSLITIVLLLAFCAPVAGQQSTAPSPANLPFPWSWQEAERVSDHHTTVTSATALTPADRSALKNAIFAHLRLLDDSEPKEKTETSAADMPIEMIDLNNDGAPEVIAQTAPGSDACGGTGNCPIWIFQRTKDEYAVLLDTYAQVFSIQGGRTNGFKDIITSQHLSAFESILTEYKFDGKAYNEGDCYKVQWRDGRHEFEHPLVTPCSE